MTDPWADVRKKHMIGTVKQIVKEQEADLKRILTDADALLTLKEPLRQIAFAPLDVHPADDELAFYKRELQRCITIAAKALAALPEHLRAPAAEIKSDISVVASEGTE